MSTFQFTLVVTGAIDNHLPPLQTSFEIESALAHTYARKLSSQIADHRYFNFALFIYNSESKELELLHEWTVKFTPQYLNINQTRIEEVK